MTTKTRKEELQGLLQAEEEVRRIIYNGNYTVDYYIHELGSTDLGRDIEKTLHRLLDNGIDPLEFSFELYNDLLEEGFYSEEEVAENFIQIDLGYCIPLIVNIEQ